MNSAATQTGSSEMVSQPDVLAPVKQMVRACIQCGTCTGSCPNAFAMDDTPRHLWRMVQMGQQDEVFSSRTFILCSDCYYCTLRCPRGLPLTEAMETLKQIAATRHPSPDRRSTEFYKTFLQSVRRHGRVNEMEFMALYFARLKNPLFALHFAPLGMKLMRKGKISLRVPLKGRHPLESIFRNVELLEDQS